MLRLVRHGAREMIVTTEKSQDFREWLESSFPVREYDLMESMNKAEPDQTVINVSPTWKHEDSIFSFVVDAPPDRVMEGMINNRSLTEYISVRLLPRYINFRIPENPQAVIEQIRRDFSGTRGKLEDLMYDNADKGVAVLFSEKSLNRPLSMDDLYEDIVYIDMPPQELFTQLQWRAISYLNQSLNDREWNLVEIRIFDTYSRYEPHCRRLRLFLRALEMGINIGEGWGKDYAHVLMPLQVFTMKILTFYSPLVLKKALMALEYSHEGKRFVDFDLYHRKKKVGWTELVDDRKLDRQSYSLEYRKEIMDNLGELPRQEILSIENEIIRLGQNRNIENKA